MGEAGDYSMCVPTIFGMLIPVPTVRIFFWDVWLNQQSVLE
jgi:hypothetical protein